MNRQLAAAVSLSLGGHAVLLAVIGFGFQKSEPPALDQWHPGSLSASVSLQANTDADTEKKSETVSENSPSVSPVESPVPQTAETFPADESAPPGSTEPSGSLSLSGEAGINSETAEGGTGMDSPGEPADAEPFLSSSLNPVYPVLARRAGIEGTVIIEVTVDRNGRPVDYSILPPGSNRILEEAAAEAVMKARYNPGIKGGRTVSGSFRIKVRFELDG